MVKLNADDTRASYRIEEVEPKGIDFTFVFPSYCAWSELQDLHTLLWFKEKLVEFRKPMVSLW